METVRILCVEQWIEGGGLRDTYMCVRKHNHGSKHIMQYGHRRFITWDAHGSSFWEA